MRWFPDFHEQGEQPGVITFPKNFLWGATLSAHQVEGGNYANDWWRWEQRPGRIRDRANSQVAAGHFTRFEADFDLARKLGMRAILFSIEWSRVQPVPKAFDEAAIAHYGAVLDALIVRGIEPVCVLHHVTNPSWFTERRGWRNRGSPDFFEAYAARMAAEFAPKCRWWVPFYEPMHAVRMAYLEGIWPPGAQNPAAGIMEALERLKQAHDRAYRAIHAQRPDAMVGAALRGRANRPQDKDRSWDVRAAHGQNKWPVRFLGPRKAWVMDRFRPWQRREPGGALDQPLDFLGVGFYGAETVRFNPFKPRHLFVKYTDAFGSPVGVETCEAAPESFYHVLREMARYGLPILVTGNGIATEEDRRRCVYLLDHLAVVHRCLQEGMDIRGYFHRAFLDGFEWTRGYSARYGLVHVARETLARTPNTSAYLYKDICESGTLRRGTLARFCPEWLPPTE